MCVSFGLSGRVAVVLGDPTASDLAMFDETLDDFLDFCSLSGWEPAFHQAPPEHLDAYRARGFTSLMIGQEAIVPLTDFTLSAKRCIVCGRRSIGERVKDGVSTSSSRRCPTRCWPS